MLISARRLAPFAVLMVATTTGCSSVSHVWSNNDDGCRGSNEYCEVDNNYEVGARQKCKKGRLWPPYPRPTSEQLSCAQRYHAEHYWPWPYNCQDQAFIHEVSARQTQNGWLQETTLFGYHFNDKNELNQAGRSQLAWILRSAPSQYRSTWVQNGETEEISQQRLASVQAAAAEIAGSQNVPAIALRQTEVYGRPAGEIDAIRKAEIGSVPKPRIEYQAVGTAQAGS